jgi:methyl-accepting chemotaxis protein
MNNRRRSIIVNKTFQYHYSLLVVALAVLLINIAILIQAFLPSDDPLIMTNSMAISLGTLEFLLIAGVWYGSLRATHKIAGPVYVFSREAAKLGRGDLTARIALRKGDVFQEVAEEMNASYDALRARVARIKAIARQLEAAGANPGQVQSLVISLNEELDGLNTEEARRGVSQEHAARGEPKQCLAHP